MNANTKRLLKNGAIGLAVMIVVGLVPMVNALASLVGGAVAGYLHKADVRGGAIVGAVTGLLWTAITLLLLVVAVVGFGITSAPGVGLFSWLPAAGGAAWVVLLFVVGNGVVVLTTTVGGVVGALLARETETPSGPEQPQY